MYFPQYILVLGLGCTLAQVPEYPPLSRGDLSVNIVVKYPEDTLEDYGYFNAPFYVYGNGLCLSWDEGTMMEHTLEDTWELTLIYTQTPAGYGCNDTSVPGLIGVNSQFEFRVVINDTVEMLGANCGSDLPISMSAPFYEDSPLVYCYPWFFTPTGRVLIERVVGEPDLIRSRNMHFYLPPSFDETFYKQYPVVFAPDLGVGIADVIFETPDRMEIFASMMDDVIVNQGLVNEIIVVGTADYWPAPGNPFMVSDRFDFLGPNTPSYYHQCKNGTTFFSGCDGCFNVSDISGIYDILFVLTLGGCGELVPTGGQADTFMDFLLNEVTNRTMEIAEDRALADQKNLGVFGCSLGGLFSCYAGWTRPNTFGHAGCQSSSFWWPQNETGDPIFDFETYYINYFREDRPFQNIFIDYSVPGDTGAEEFRMDSAALNLANSMAELPVFDWNRNLWLEAYMGKAHGNIECMERAWQFLGEFYRPVGGPRNPMSPAPPPPPQRTSESSNTWSSVSQPETMTEQQMKNFNIPNVEKMLHLMKGKEAL